MAKREFFVVIEQDDDGWFVGEVPQLKACYSQGKTIDELMENMRDVIKICLEEDEFGEISRFVGIQRIEV